MTEMFGDISSAGPVGGSLEKVLDGLRGDVTAMCMVLAMARMCADITDKQGWDCAPELWTVERELPPAGLADRLRENLHAEAMLLSATPLGLADSMPDGADGLELAYILTSVAKGIAQEGEEAAAAMGHRDVIGWMLSHEAWRLTGEEARVYNESGPGDGGQVKERASSQEMRVLIAADRVGYLYLVQQIRGRDGLEIVVDRDRVVRGGLPDSLRALVAALPPPAT